MPLSYLAVPQQALIRGRESPLARFDSQVSPPSRKRTVTLSGDGSAPPQLGVSELSNPVVLEMRKGALLDVGNVLNQFAKLDKDISNVQQRPLSHFEDNRI